MTNPPYTDADLRIEAARQHHALTEDPDFMGVGEQMEDASVDHTDDNDTSLTWQELLVPEGGGSWEAFDEAQRKIHDLINYAADISGWAVALGADGLEPYHDSLSIDNDAEGTPFVRLHFAFRPDVPKGAGPEFMTRVASLLESMEDHKVTWVIRPPRP